MLPVLFCRQQHHSPDYWTNYIREAAEHRGFRWVYWEFRAGFSVYDRDTRQWRDYLLRALLSDSAELN